jgi:drug/metabolite transporter (DMT)-like permease
MSPARARVEIAVATLFLSTGGASIKFCDLTPWQIASYRSAIAAVTMLLVLPAARRGFRPATALVGAAQAASMVVFVLANKLTTAAATIFLQSTAPLYVLVLAPLLLRERPARADLFFMAALALGLLLLIGGEQAPLASAPHPTAGNAFAALGGLAWALTLLGLRWLGRGGDAGAQQAAAVSGNLLAFAACLPVALAAGSPVSVLGQPADAAVLLYLGVVQIALAYAILTRALRALPALEASLFVLLEPVLNPLWAWLVQGEVPAWTTLAGGAVILGATLARAASRR